MLTIEKGITPPEPRYKFTRNPNSLQSQMRAVAVQMQIGDSVFVPGKTSKQVSVYLHDIRRMTKYNFVSANEAGGVRIFRIEGVYTPRQRKAEAAPRAMPTRIVTAAF